MILFLFHCHQSIKPPLISRQNFFLSLFISIASIHRYLLFILVYFGSNIDIVIVGWLLMSSTSSSASSSSLWPLSSLYFTLFFFWCGVSSSFSLCYISFRQQKKNISANLCTLKYEYIGMTFMFDSNVEWAEISRARVRVRQNEKYYNDCTSFAAVCVCVSVCECLWAFFHLVAWIRLNQEA